ncbi:hypothetical protein [Pseudonocardia sp. ICBG601]|uniref:hypothetical protein n=1 Tax=Pseudonocardia sp. ICBG601 TaxID=2846759 RepID=UPI001CF6CF7A|nr:hypothetical protein [Pseudonocardia sp. ICBG601]
MKLKVKDWRAAHLAFIADAEKMPFCAVKNGEPLTQADVKRLLVEHGLELPLSVGTLMRHW